jgi:hypothetical protein
VRRFIPVAPSLPAGHLDARIQAKGIATFSSDVQQTSRHRLSRLWARVCSASFTRITARIGRVVTR